MSDPFFDDTVVSLTYVGAAVVDFHGGNWTLRDGGAVSSTQQRTTGADSLYSGVSETGSIISDKKYPLSDGQEFTIERSFYIESFPDQPMVVAGQWGQGGGPRSWVCYLLSTTVVRFGVSTDGSNEFSVDITLDSALPFSQWVDLAIVRTGLTTLTVFVDGVKQTNTGTLAGSVWYATPTSFLELGRFPSAVFGKWDGYSGAFRLTEAARYTTNYTVELPWPESGLAPTIDTQPQPQTVTEGNNAVYTVAATTSGGTLLYQWYETTAGILGGETADTLTITTVLGDNGNGYYVTVTDDNDTVTSDTAALTVNAVIPPPSGTSTIFDDSKGFPSEEYENAIDRITFMMQELEGSLCDCRDDPNVVVCVALLSSTGIYNTELQGGGEPTPIAGETLTLGVGVAGTGPYTYQWKVDGVDVVGATSLTFDYVVTLANASITVQVTNECSTILVGPYLVEVTDVITLTCPVQVFIGSKPFLFYVNSDRTPYMQNAMLHADPATGRCVTFPDGKSPGLDSISTVTKGIYGVSSDGGDTWDTYGMDTIPGNWANDPSNPGWIGNAWNNFTQIASGMTIHPSGKWTIGCYGTGGYGVVYSTNGGVTWKRENPLLSMDGAGFFYTMSPGAIDDDRVFMGVDNFAQGNLTKYNPVTGNVTRYDPGPGILTGQIYNSIYHQGRYFVSNGSSIAEWDSGTNITDTPLGHTARRQWTISGDTILITTELLNEPETLIRYSIADISPGAMIAPIITAYTLDSGFVDIAHRCTASGFGNGLFVMVAAERNPAQVSMTGEISIFTSPDGINWSEPFFCTLPSIPELDVNRNGDAMRVVWAGGAKWLLMYRDNTNTSVITKFTIT